MMKERDKAKWARTITRQAALWGLCMCAVGCGARSQETFDSQSHWLSCAEETQCGGLACECGLCTVSCESDDECWAELGTGAARCQAIESFDCQSPTATRICVPDCADERCVSMDGAAPGGAEASGDSTLRPEAPLELVSVPECPAATAAVGLAAQFRTALTEYTGPATVDESNGERIRLVPDAAVGEVVEVTNHPLEVAQLLAAGQRYDVAVESSSEDGGYKALIVRDDQAKVLLAIYHGYDTWYQSGRFQDASLLGGALELRMTCQSDVGDVCFESQVQSSYVGLFTADTQVTVDGTQYETVTIGGEPYGVYSWAFGVFGGVRMTDCHPDVVQGRTIAFALYRQPPP